MNQNMDKNMNQNTDSNRKILIDDVNVITNGSPEELKYIKKPNAIGKVINTETNEELCEITPLVMIMNQSSRDVHEKISSLLEAGADPDIEITYYNNKKITARKLATTYRSTIHFP